ncbi:unnamed protein product [Musa textilis]
MYDRHHKNMKRESSSASGGDRRRTEGLRSWLSEHRREHLPSPDGTGSAS